MPNEPIRFLDALAVLVRHDVEFIVVGGVAVILEGAPVSTLDLDIVHERSHLYYRLNVIHIRVPPLPERPEDVPGLVHHLLRRQATLSGSPVPIVTADAMRVFC